MGRGGSSARATGAEPGVSRSPASPSVPVPLLASASTWSGPVETMLATRRMRGVVAADSGSRRDASWASNECTVELRSRETGGTFACPALSGRRRWRCGMEDSRPRAAAVAVAVVVAVAGTAAAAPPGAKKVVPDLYVMSFTAEGTGVLADGSHRVRLTARVGLRATAKASTGPFKLAVAQRTTGLRSALGGGGKSRLFRPLREAGIADMSYDPTRRLAPIVVRTFDTTVPEGQQREFRLTVDSMKQVAEADEGNNTALASYRATGCPGTDLQLTRMRLQRRADGDTVVDVWIKNRCSVPCEAFIHYLIDESEAVPGGDVVERGIVPRLDGETEVGPVGATIVNGVAGADATYSVRIEARGDGCTETNTFNNRCRGTIRAGETTKTIDCTNRGYMVFRNDRD